MVTNWPAGQRVVFGGDYNPEQWPRATWEEDVALMREAGVNFVSIGMWAWSLLEPSEGDYNFEDYDHLINLLHDNGIAVDLGTPSASPPSWFYHKYPGARVVHRDGTVVTNGSRGAAAPTSPQYREAAAKIAGKLAERYADHPGVVMWHIHNEYGAPVSHDYSDNARRAWPLWLQERYGTLDELNRAWGTAFWGQTYFDWDHVGLPAISASVTNPAQRLDFARFSDAQLRECYLAEYRAIREFSDKPITTNFMANECPATDVFAWAKEIDIISNDHYLTAEDERNFVGLSLAADLTRGAAGGAPWMLMEHSTSGVNWQPRNVAKLPGELARNSLAHVARGSDSVLYFQWRASRFGAEKFHSAMLPHGGKRTKVWQEVVELGNRLTKFDDVQGSRVHSEVAILWDTESHWAQDLEWRPTIDHDHKERTRAFYERTWRDGITTDFVHPSADLSSYKLVLVPALYLLSDADAENLRQYVAGGGTLVVSYFSAIVDENDTVHANGYLGALADVLGLQVEEFHPLRANNTVQVSGLAGTLSADVWVDDLMINSAQVQANYVDGPLPGAPALTRNSFGEGQAWYVGTRFGIEELAAVLAGAYRDAGVVVVEKPEDLELVVRRGDREDFLFAINHTTQTASVALEQLGAMFGGTPPAGTLEVPAGEVTVLRVDRNSPRGWSTL